MPTLSDIAQRTFVSASTVSRVLSNHPHVNEITRAKVLQAADDLGYLRENLRRTPQNQRSVLLVGMGRDPRSQTQSGSNPHEMSTEFARQILGSVQSFFERFDVAAKLQSLQTNQPDNAQKGRFSMSRAQRYAGDTSVAGLILLGGELDDEFIEDLLSTNLPFVMAGGSPRSLRVNCVVANYCNGLEQAVGYLAATGRRRIGLVNGPSTTMTSKEKYRGFRLALSLHDLSFTPAQLVAGNFTPKEGHEQTLRLLKQTPDLDAIIYGDDYMALGGIHALKENGRQVPGDVAVIGFHNYEMAEFTNPPLSSIHFNMQNMGIVAARRLSMLLEGPGDNEPWFVLEPTTLVVRKSS